jgi:isoquinoline 1-oxidoreductase subunit alpha
LFVALSDGKPDSTFPESAPDSLFVALSDGKPDSTFPESALTRFVMRYSLNVNGQDHTVDVDDDTPLLWVLRDAMNLKGTKYGCGSGLCGACTVHIDGQPVQSCRMPVSSIATSKIVTIEGIGTTPAGVHLQEAWLKIDVMQCGYCQPGQIMAAAALLAQNPEPSDDDIVNAMDNHICRCGTYSRIKLAIKMAADAQKGA